MGLSIVKGIVEMHGGSVSVESDGLIQGSTFAIHLPLPCEVDDYVAHNDAII